MRDVRRYVEVTGPAATDSVLECYALRSDVDVTGAFDSSSPLLNEIHAMERATAEANMMSIQSTPAYTTLNINIRVIGDCPHRERLGYGGDALMSGESFIQNFDMALFYEKRVQDYNDAQRSNGSPFIRSDRLQSTSRRRLHRDGAVCRPAGQRRGALLHDCAD